MSQTNNLPQINQLISYYQALNNLNITYADINTNDTDNSNYTNLIEQLVAIRERLIKNAVNGINAVYKPIEQLFIYRSHYQILEDTVQFYKQNSTIAYPIPETKASEIIDSNDSNIDTNTELTQSTGADANQTETAQNLNNSLVQSSDDVQTKLAAIEEKLTIALAQNDSSSHNETEIATRTEILNDLTTIKELLHKIASHEFNQSAIKSTQDALAAIHTNFELMKADLSKYDALLTDHINKSSATALNAMGKEHARFVLEASAEINAIVRGIREANAPDFAVQNDLMQKNAKIYEDKSFKYFCFSFIMSIFAIFSCAILTSHWVAGKVLDNAKVLKISTVCSSAPVASQKHRIRNY